jgi:hypothetical protein
MQSEDGLIKAGDIVVLKKGIKEPRLGAKAFRGFAVVEEGQERYLWSHITLGNGYVYDPNDLTRVGSGF